MNDSWIDDLLLNFAKRVESYPRGKTYGWEAEKAQIVAKLEEAIGPDEVLGDPGTGEMYGDMIYARNKLKAEIRQRLTAPTESSPREGGAE
jgi:hypothetical protein